MNPLSHALRAGAALALALLVALPAALADTPSPADALARERPLPPRATPEPSTEKLFALDASVGVDFLRGHDSSDVIDGTEQIIWSAGAMTLNAGATWLARTGETGSLLLGIDATFGFGSFVRFWSAGFSFQPRFDFGDVSFRLGLGLGATQLSAGGRDVTDAVFAVLRDYLIAEGQSQASAESIASSETVGKRIESPVTLYVKIQPGVVWQLDSTFRLFADVPVIFSPSVAEFTLSGRTYREDSSLGVPGFAWRGIGFGINVGASFAF